MPIQRVERDDNSRLVTRLLNTSSRSVGKKITTDNQRQDAVMNFRTIGEINSKVKRPLTRSNRREMRSKHHTTVSKIGGSVKRSPDHIVGEGSLEIPEPSFADGSHVEVEPPAPVTAGAGRGADVDGGDSSVRWPGRSSGRRAPAALPR